MENSEDFQLCMLLTDKTTYGWIGYVKQFGDETVEVGFGTRQTFTFFHWEVYLL